VLIKTLGVPASRSGFSSRGLSELPLKNRAVSDINDDRLIETGVAGDLQAGALECGARW
jgi:hypothetical protein